MRIALKGTIVLLLLYLFFLGGIAVWLRNELTSVAGTLARDTARMVGREVGRALSDSAVHQLLRGDAETQARLERQLSELTEESYVIGSVAVIDVDGKITVSNDPAEIGQQVALPQPVEGDREAVEFRTEVQQHQGTYDVFFPLVLRDQVHGHVRVRIASRRIDRLYWQVRRQFLITAGLGFVGVVVLGVFLHLYLTRRVATLADVLESVLRGESPSTTGRNDEFADAIEAARRLGNELSAAREQSEQTARKLGAMTKVADVGVLLLAPDMNVEFSNEEALRLLGCSDMVELEERWKHFRPELKRNSGKHCTDGSAALTIDFEADAPQGSRPVRLELYRSDEQEGAGYVVLVKDRAMIRALEDELGLAIQMRGLARFHMAFVHDLRAPLNAMVMNLELLRRSLAENGDSGGEEPAHARQERYISVLSGEISRVERQLKALLAHGAAPTDGRDTFDLRDLIADLFSLLEPMAQQQKVRVEVDVPSDPAPFSGSRDRLKQAILNIAINALEAMPDGGRMAIRLRFEGRHAHLSLEDTGAGISSEAMASIFDMHFTTKSGGTGIGLYVARSVVEGYGGEIRVDRASGGGTRFEIYLPLALHTV